MNINEIAERSNPILAYARAANRDLNEVYTRAEMYRRNGGVEDVPEFVALLELLATKYQWPTTRTPTHWLTGDTHIDVRTLGLDIQFGKHEKEPRWTTLTATHPVVATNNAHAGLAAAQELKAFVNQKFVQLYHRAFTTAFPACNGAFLRERLTAVLRESPTLTLSEDGGSLTLSVTVSLVLRCHGVNYTWDDANRSHQIM